MAYARRIISAFVTGTVVLVSPVSAPAHEALGTDGQPVSTALRFNIIIPAVLRIIENRHPSSLPATDTQTLRISARQHMVLVSTLRKGFCMDLGLTHPLVVNWQVQVSGSASTWIESSVGGYRLCAGHAGRYDLSLQHEFGLKEVTRGSMAPAIDWPVSVSLAAP